MLTVLAVLGSRLLSVFSASQESLLFSVTCRCTFLRNSTLWSKKLSQCASFCPFVMLKIDLRGIPYFGSPFKLILLQTLYSAQIRFSNTSSPRELDAQVRAPRSLFTLAIVQAACAQLLPPLAETTRPQPEKN